MLGVEDDASSLTALVGILRFWGWQVETATTVAAAMGKLDAGVTHVLLDLMLPDGDGADVLKHIRDARLPIAVTVTTGLSDQMRLEEVRRFSPEGILVKPIDLNRLRECLA